MAPKTFADLIGWQCTATRGLFCHCRSRIRKS